MSTATISSVTPDNGLPGTQVTIAGSGFGSSQGIGQVWLGTANGVVQTWSDTQVVALVASGSVSGSAQVLQNAVTSNAFPFTVNVPHITSIDPTSGASGTSVTITGSGFGAIQDSGTVLLGSLNGQVVSWSGTQVVAAVASTSLTGIVRIQQNSYASNAVAFTVPATNGVTLMPNLVNMAIGDTRTLQALDSNGQSVTGLTWTSSDTGVVSLSTDDPPVLTALAAGHVTIKAGSAATDVTVFSGPLPTGTVIWSNPGSAGVTRIVPAVPSPTGVADVFAFQDDGTVQAITSDGITAWTVAVSPNAYTIVPDFQGGLVQGVASVDSTPGSIGKFDGITGQYQTLYEGDTTGLLAVSTDGTMFTIHQDENSASVIGIDGINGGQKFSVPIPHTDYIPDTPNAGYLQVPGSAQSLIVAGDGYAYLTYYWTTKVSYQPLTDLYHLMLIRVSTSGAIDSSEIYSVSGFQEVGFISTGLISNGDTGVLLTFVPSIESQLTHLAITTGTSVSQIATLSTPDNQEVTPVLQAQDGSFVGSYFDDEGQVDMIAFDANGSVRWSVPNEQPQIATADGGVIGTSGITYDQNGNATGQNNSLTPSWIGNTYSAVNGALLNLVQLPPRYASSFQTAAAGNLSENATSVPFLTFIEGMPFFAAAGKGPSCKLGTAKVSLGGDPRDQYDLIKQALLGGNYLTSHKCQDFFVANNIPSNYFSLLTSAVTNQTPWDGLQTTISMYEAGFWNAHNENQPTFPGVWQKTAVCQTFNVGVNKRIVAVSQIQPPATDIYINTNPKVRTKYLTQSTILHEALHNLTRLEDDALAEMLGTGVAADGATNTINDVLVRNGCAAN